MEGYSGKGVVCVTGGTGFVASWLIMRLLEQGYTVRTTVRSNPTDGKQGIGYLTGLPGAKERLQIFNADLDRPDSFNEAIEGCTGVFHVAHPTGFTKEEAEEMVIKRATEGTIGVLQACLNSKTVKRVVYTSGISTVLFSGNGQQVADESAWTDIDYFRSLNVIGNPSLIAKTYTERAALEFAEQHGLDLVTLIPSLVFGPFICPKIPRSVHMGLAMVLGNRNHYRFLIKSNMVHIDDVAMAHIFLLENSNAKGRYLCSSNEVSLNEMFEFLSATYPDLQIPARESISSLKDIEGFKMRGLSPKKLLDCGFKFEHGLEDMFDGAIQSCKEKGFL
ncbi:vestitone reductase isoform X1 [Populus trichocarpa]|uniref:vestitone reductase isoform X1 n=1 Tax=Populus trichocarpa TaxID=3694 RepID=UPI002278EE3B|nr:vestitone reductase isoform X1 [Populus trichocarpa]